jgi:hypothetical protein
MSDRGTWKILIGGATLVDYASIVNARDNDGGPIIQAEALFRAESMAFFERDNFQLHLVFDLTIEQANNAASMLFFLTGPQTWSGVDDVALTHKDHSGAETTKNLTGASVRLKCSQPIGVTNLATLTITGGVIS